MTTLPTWHVATAEPRREQYAVIHLAESGLRAFAPYAYRTVVSKGQKHSRKMQVFPGYVFFAARPGAPFQIARRCRHVRSILMKTHDTAQEIAPAWMEAMIGQCDPGGYMRKADELPTALPPLAVGQEVKIVDGSFAGLITRVAALEAQGVLCVDIDMFGAKRSVSIARKSVEPVA